MIDEVSSDGVDRITQRDSSNVGLTTRCRAFRSTRHLRAMDARRCARLERALRRFLREATPWGRPLLRGDTAAKAEPTTTRDVGDGDTATNAEPTTTRDVADGGSDSFNGRARDGGSKDTEQRQRRRARGGDARRRWRGGRASVDLDDASFLTYHVGAAPPAVHVDVARGQVANLLLYLSTRCGEPRLSFQVFLLLPLLSMIRRVATRRRKNLDLAPPRRRRSPTR